MAPGWAPPGTEAPSHRWRYDMQRGFVPPGHGAPRDGTQYMLPEHFDPASAPKGFHLVESPPGTAAPIEHINYTPDTREVHHSGALAPVDKTNFTLVPHSALRPRPPLRPPAPGPRAGGVGAGQDEAGINPPKPQSSPFAGTPPLSSGPFSPAASPTAHPGWGMTNTGFFQRGMMGAGQDEGDDDTDLTQDDPTADDGSIDVAPASRPDSVSPGPVEGPGLPSQIDRGFTGRIQIDKDHAIEYQQGKQVGVWSRKPGAVGTDPADMTFQRSTADPRTGQPATHFTVTEKPDGSIWQTDDRTNKTTRLQAPKAAPKPPTTPAGPHQVINGTIYTPDPANPSGPWVPRGGPGPTTKPSSTTDKPWRTQHMTDGSIWQTNESTGETRVLQGPTSKEPKGIVVGNRVVQYNADAKKYEEVYRAPAELQLQSMGGRIVGTNRETGESQVVYEDPLEREITGQSVRKGELDIQKQQLAGVPRAEISGDNLFVPGGAAASVEDFDPFTGVRSTRSYGTRMTPGQIVRSQYGDQPRRPSYDDSGDGGASADLAARYPAPRGVEGGVPVEVGTPPTPEPDVPANEPEIGDYGGMGAGADSRRKRKSGPRKSNIQANLRKDIPNFGRKKRANLSPSYFGRGLDNFTPFVGAGQEASQSPDRREVSDLPYAPPVRRQDEYGAYGWVPPWMRSLPPRPRDMVAPDQQREGPAQWDDTTELRPFNNWSFEPARPLPEDVPGVPTGPLGESPTWDLWYNRDLEPQPTIPRQTDYSPRPRGMPLAPAMPRKLDQPVVGAGQESAPGAPGDLMNPLQRMMAQLGASWQPPQADMEPSMGWNPNAGPASYVGAGQGEPDPMAAMAGGGGPMGGMTPDPTGGMLGGAGWQPPLDPGSVVGTGHTFGQPLQSQGGGESIHKGVDLQAPHGTPVRAPVDGTVQIENNPNGLGLQVSVMDGQGNAHKLGHLASATVKPGEQVRQGQVIGTVGASGRTTGAHLDVREQAPDGQYKDPALKLGAMAALPPAPGTQMMGAGQDDEEGGGDTGGDTSGDASGDTGGGYVDDTGGGGYVDDTGGGGEPDYSGGEPDPSGGGGYTDPGVDYSSGDTGGTDYSGGYAGGPGEDYGGAYGPAPGGGGGGGGWDNWTAGGGAAPQWEDPNSIAPSGEVWRQAIEAAMSGRPVTTGYPVIDNWLLGPPRGGGSGYTPPPPVPPKFQPGPGGGPKRKFRAPDGREFDDPGDYLFYMAGNNTLPSGPGGTIRDRAVVLARQSGDPQSAYAQATQEFNSGRLGSTNAGGLSNYNSRVFGQAGGAGGRPAAGGRPGPAGVQRPGPSYPQGAPAGYNPNDPNTPYATGDPNDPSGGGGLPPDQVGLTPAAAARLQIDARRVQQSIDAENNRHAEQLQNLQQDAQRNADWKSVQEAVNQENIRHNHIQEQLQQQQQQIQVQLENMREQFQNQSQGRTMRMNILSSALNNPWLQGLLNLGIAPSVGGQAVGGGVMRRLMNEILAGTGPSAGTGATAVPAIPGVGAGQAGSSTRLNGTGGGAMQSATRTGASLFGDTSGFGSSVSVPNSPDDVPFGDVGGDRPPVTNDLPNGGYLGPATQQSPEPDVGTFMGWSPAQRAAWRTDIEAQGPGSWQEEVAKFQQRAGTSQAPGITRLASAIASPLDTLGYGQIADVFGEGTPTFWNRMQRAWSAADAPGVRQSVLGT